MSVYQRLVRDVIAPLALWRAGDLRQLHYQREYERTQFLAPHQLRALQFERLQLLLEHAYARCPFYRARFESVGLLPGDLRCLEDLTRLPVLEKRDIQEHRDDLVAQGWPSADLLPNRTGGSTGRPLSFFMDQDRLRSRTAATIRHNRWAGWDVGDKAALLWGAPRDLPGKHWRQRLRNLLLERQLFLDTGHLTEERMADFNATLKTYRPKVILAYAQAAALFSRFLRANRLTPYRPTAIITSAEVLEDADRAVIEEVFGCRVFNRYGCREVSVIASECSQHQGLHVMAEGLFVEIVKGDRPARPGEMGALLVTDLLNRAMPLIRYRIGDLGAWAAGPCPCGRGLPLLEKVAGRVTDFLVGTDGRLVSGAFLSLYLVGQRPSLGQVQIVQEKRGQVCFRIHAGRSFEPATDLDFLQEQTRRFLGESMAVDWEFVDELKPEPSGKYLFSRSSVAPDYVAVAPPTAVGGLCASEGQG